MLNDHILLSLLSSIGNQLEGFKYTKGTVERGLDPVRVLDSRKKRLEEDIKTLINYIKEAY